jgi:hypothetical protein
MYTYVLISQVFERVRTIQRGSLVYVIVEPDDDESSSFFTTYVIDSATGESLSTIKIPCGANYDDVTYVGNYLLWTEEDTLNWTPVDKNDIKSTSIKVEDTLNFFFFFVFASNSLVFFLNTVSCQILAYCRQVCSY